MPKTKKETTKENHQFNVEKRSITGKKVKQLRKKGITPANIYGEDFKSKSIQFPTKDFKKLYKKLGSTQIVYLHLDKESIPALIHVVQTDPVYNTLQHVDFRKVSLSKKIEATVPVKYMGESEAVSHSKGILLTITDKLIVESLPTEIPSVIEVDITALKELDQEIKVKDLKNSTQYVFKEDPEKVIVRITEHKEESTESQVVAPETVEVTTEKKEETEDSSSEVKPKQEETKEESPKK